MIVSICEWRSCQPSGEDSRVQTLRLAVDPEHLETAEARFALDRAAEILRSGGLVALPTETVYGLGANALDPAAVARIFTAKQRPSWDPVIVHIAGPVEASPMLGQLATDIPAPARRLIAAFWPGPLTLLLPRSGLVPDAVTAGRPLVGVRMPAHPVALQLIRRAGVPVAAPSANTFSRTSPTTAAHVLEDLDGRIDAILDAGPTAHGVESTVLDPGQTPMVIYRPGAVTAEQIRSVAGPVETYQKEVGTPAESPQGLPSPGVGMRHYAPRARLVLIDAPLLELPAQLARIAELYSKERIGLMLPAEVAAAGGPEMAVFSWGRWEAPEEMAHLLYAGLRALDGLNCTVILCPIPPGGGVGDAIRDRLRKAARNQ